MRVNCALALIVTAFLAGCVRATPPAEQVPASSEDFYDWRKASDYTDEQLIEFLTTSSMIRHARRKDATDRDREFPYEVFHELSGRKPVELLLETLGAGDDPSQRRWVVLTLYGIDDERIDAAFRARLSEETGEEAYYIANYLAKRGDADALAILNRNYGCYPVSSLQWSYTVRLFGEHSYRPAAPNLVESLDAASLNVSGAAYESLREIFPGEHPRHQTIAEACEYFSRLLEGDSADTIGEGGVAR